MSSIFKIVKLSQKKEAKQKSAYFHTEKIRKRVYVNTLGSLVFKEFLEDNNFKVNEGESYLDNFHLAEVLDVSDLKIDTLRIDCRCIVDSEYKQLWIPKKPYEFGYIFDFYIALRLETNTNRIEIIGYITQELLNKAIENTEQNQNYYILDASVLKPIQDLPEAIFISLNYLKETKVFQDDDHNIVIEKIPDYLDNELSSRERMLFQKHIIECDSCRESLLYSYLFNNKLKQIPNLENLIVNRTKDIEPEINQETQTIPDNNIQMLNTDPIINTPQEVNISEADLKEPDTESSFEYIQMPQENYEPPSFEDIQMPQEDYEPPSFEDIQIPCDECQQPEIYEDYVQQEPEFFEYNQVDFEDAMTSDDSIYEHLGISQVDHEQFNALEIYETTDISKNKQEDNKFEEDNKESIPLEDNLRETDIETIIPQQPLISNRVEEEDKFNSIVTDPLPTEEHIESFQQSFEQPKSVTPEEDLSVYNYPNTNETDIQDDFNTIQSAQEHKTDDLLPTDAEITDLEQFVNAKKENAISKKKKKFNAIPLLLVASIAAAGGILIFKGQIVMPNLANVGDNLKKYIASGMDSIKFTNEKKVETKEIAKVPSIDILSDKEMTKFTDGSYLKDTENKTTEEKIEDVSTPEIKKENVNINEVSAQTQDKDENLVDESKKTTEKAKKTSIKKQIGNPKNLEIPKQTIEKTTTVKAKEEKKPKEGQIKDQKAITKINVPKETDKKASSPMPKKEKPLLASNLSPAFVAPRSIAAPAAPGGLSGSLYSKQNESPHIYKDAAITTQKGKEKGESSYLKTTETTASASFGVAESTKKQSKKDIPQNDNLLSALSEKKESIKLGLSKAGGQESQKFIPVNVSWKPSTSQQIETNLKNFINSAAQNTKSTLNTDLKNNEIPGLSRSTVVTVKINNYKKSVMPQISVSSGSSRVDNIILNSVKKGFSSSSLPKDNTSSEPIEIKVTVAQ